MDKKQIISYFNQFKEILKNENLFEKYVFNNLCGEKLFYKIIEKENNIDIEFSNQTCVLSSVVAIFISKEIHDFNVFNDLKKQFKELLLQKKLTNNNFLNLFSELKDLRRIQCLFLPFNII